MEGTPKIPVEDKENSRIEKEIAAQKKVKEMLTERLKGVPEWIGENPHFQSLQERDLI